jgi:hypothetical protein
MSLLPHLSPSDSLTRLLEKLDFRFGAFRALACASLREGEGGDFCPSMDLETARALLEFGEDLHEVSQHAFGKPTPGV